METKALPNDVLIRVFSFLAGKQIQALSRVCKSWYHAANDDHLWKLLFLSQAPTWRRICCHCGVNTQTMYPNKKRFFQNHPVECDECVSTTVTSSSPFSLVQAFKTFTGSVSTVIMFGPGMDTASDSLVSQIMWESNFGVRGMFQGDSNDPLGTGVLLKHEQILQDIKLIAWYRATKGQRTNRKGAGGAEGGPRVNRLIEQGNLERSQTVCKTAQAFVYIADSSVQITSEIRREFDLLTLRQDPTCQIPVLCLLCDPPQEEEARGKTPTRLLCCSDLVQQLELKDMSRPWMCMHSQLHSSVIATFEQAIFWLLPSEKMGRRNIVPSSFETLLSNLFSS
eukprot:Lithocolla_globosa_v1_NODE_5707_length_1198_cov_392.125984.p1 type:complete len:338 gc:universal NODE_5707_length_1198_cov_392.125984:1158-145(-)